jgi:hypothetical protein
LLMEHASWSMHIPRPMFFVRWSGIIWKEWLFRSRRFIRELFAAFDREWDGRALLDSFLERLTSNPGDWNSQFCGAIGSCAGKLCHIHSTGTMLRWDLLRARISEENSLWHNFDFKINGLFSYISFFSWNICSFREMTVLFRNDSLLPVSLFLRELGEWVLRSNCNSRKSQFILAHTLSYQVTPLCHGILEFILA